MFSFLTSITTNCCSYSFSSHHVGKSTLKTVALVQAQLMPLSDDQLPPLTLSSLVVMINLCDRMSGLEAEQRPAFKISAPTPGAYQGLS